MRNKNNSLVSKIGTFDGMKMWELEDEIERTVVQLDKWINEVHSGGWSTQHVSQMQRTANRLRKSLNKKEKNYETKNL